MKQVNIAIRAAALIPAAALLATPAFAQDASVAPLVVQPAPAPAPQAPARAPQAVTPPPVVSTSPIVEVPTAEVVADEAPARTARTRTTRPGARVAARAVPAAPVAAVVEPVAPTAPIAAAPVDTAPVDVTPAPVADAPVTPVDQATTTTTETSAPTWPWIAGAIALLLAVGAFFALRRRRTEDEVYYEEEAVVTEPAYVEPVRAQPEHAAAIGAAMPISAAHTIDETVEEQAELVAADADEVAAITAADAPAGRPWIELSFRPVRAGTTEDSATVDVELTIGNAGEVAAKNVRVSTFMLGDQADAPTDMEHLLATDHAGTQVDAGRIEPGEGSRVDATLSVARDTMSGRSFSPVVVADVRYDLPGGGEGRTAASFVVGASTDGETLIPLQLGGDTREDVGAALHGELERA